MTAPILTFLTDFGLRDGYVAAVKGVILSRCPTAQIIDITHDIPPGAIDAAAYVLRQAAPYFPAETIHLVVVDPGVGSERRAVACRIGAQSYVAPDNGVLSGVLDESAAEHAYALTRRELWNPEVSSVFHARDVFGPVAGSLAAGLSLAEVGEAIHPESLARMPWPQPSSDGESWQGQVIYVDRFGNLVTNIPLDVEDALAGTAQVAGREIAPARTYSDVPEGSLVALRGSSGLLEIARNRGDAAQILGVDRGSLVTFRFPRRS